MLRNTQISLIKLTLSAAVLSLCGLSSQTLTANEGMWQPYQLPTLKKDLKKMGLKISPNKLSKLTEFPMNAIVSLGGCSASFVSPQGLVATNHHCAYGSIQFNSTPENNLLENGFLAKTFDQELQAAPGSRIYVTEAVSNVSEQINAQVGSELLEYFLTKQLEIRDVRLVHAPAASIGKYGGDVDNWIWPRHTGDYAFYRAYVGKDGKPADYSEDNVAFKPKGYLRTNPNGVKAGDFIMVAGYPGRTNRYRLASEVKNTIEWNYPTRITEFNAWLDDIKQLSASDEDTEIKYASLVAGLNNAEKNNRGMLDGFAKSDVVERKLKLQEDLQTWIEGSPKRKEKYSATLNTLNELVAATQADQVRAFYYDFMAQRSALLGSAKTLYRLAKEKQKDDVDREPGYQERDFKRIEEGQKRLDRQHIAVFDKWFGIDGNNIDETRLNTTVEQMFANTELTSQAKRLEWMNATAEDFENSDDPFIQLAVALYDSNMMQEAKDKELTGKLQEIRPQYMQAIIRSQHLTASWKKIQVLNPLTHRRTS